MLQAAMTIQRLVRRSLAKISDGRMNSGILAFQALFRGYNTRKRTWQTMRLKIAATRLVDANYRAFKSPNMQLGPRTLAALNIMHSSSSLAEIMNALFTLEMSTRFSKTCCESLVNTKATDILFNLIKQCNRSKPHIQLLSCILQVIKNVTKYDPLLTYYATVPFVEVILDLVQQFRDKEEIFCLSCLLLERCIRSDRDVKVCTSELRGGK